MFKKIEKEDTIMPSSPSLSILPALVGFSIATIVFATWTHRKSKSNKSDNGNEEVFFPPLPDPVVNLLR